MHKNFKIQIYHLFIFWTKPINGWIQNIDIQMKFMLVYCFLLLRSILINRACVQNKCPLKKLNISIISIFGIRTVWNKIQKNHQIYWPLRNQFEFGIISLNSPLENCKYFHFVQTSLMFNRFFRKANVKIETSKRNK